MRTRRPLGGTLRRARPRPSWPASKSTTSGLCFVWIRWSGHGAPTWLTSGPRADEANATAAGLLSTSSTTPSASASRAPRRAGRAPASRSSASAVRERSDLDPAEAGPPSGRLSDRVGGAADELERAPVALLAGLAPGDEPVLLEQNRPRALLCLQELRDPARHVEAGPLVVEPHRLVAERVRREPSSVRRGRERDHRVRVRVVDVRRGDEGVQKRLDRRSRLVRPERGAQEVVDHLGVVHLGALAQRQDLVEPEGGEAGGRDRREVCAGALHPQHPRLAPGVVGDGPLRRGVAAALVRERAIGAEQVGAVDEPFEHAEPAAAASSQRSAGAAIAFRALVVSLTSVLPPARSWLGRRRRPGRSRRGSGRRSRLPPRPGAARTRSAAPTPPRPRACPRARRERPSRAPGRGRCRARSPRSGPARTGTPQTSAVSRQSSSFRAPPPITWTTSTSRPVTRCSRSSTKRYLHASETSTERTTSPGVSGAVWPATRHASRILPGMSPGARKASSSGSNSGTPGRRLCRERVEVVVVVRVAGRFPVAAALLDEPQAHHVAEQPDRPVDAALVREVEPARSCRRARARRARDRAATTCPTRAPPPPGRAVARRRTQTRCRDQPRPEPGRPPLGRLRPRDEPRSAPSDVPGSTRSCANGAAGSRRREISSRAQVPVRASSRPVVEAAVRSLASSPVSQKAIRSGTSAMRSAAASARRPLVRK